jgi:hypothetical protein
MFTEAGVTGSDDWWILRLATQLGHGFPRLKKLQSYRDGTCMVPAEASMSSTVAFQMFIRMCRLNMAELVSSARTNRMKPEAFKTAAPGDDDGDALAMATWKRSSMKVGIRDVFSDMVDFGEAFVTTTGPRKPAADAQPTMLPSNGWTTAVSPLAAQPWMAEAAITVGYDPINRADLMTLFRPGYMRQAFRSSAVPSIPSDGTPWTPGIGWSWVSDAIPLGYTQDVPVVSYRSRGGVGVYENHLDALDRVNHTILQRSEIIAMQAFRQLAIQGNLPERYPAGHPQAGQKIDYDQVYKAGPGALWLLPDSAKIWESAVTDITPITGAVKDDVKNLAAVTSTPIYILSPDAANGSAEGASLARESLIFAVEDLVDRAEAALAQSHSLAFQALGDAVRAQVGDISTMWAPIDRSSMTERAAAAAQAKTGGLSQQMIDEKIFQLTPEEMAQERQNLQDQAFLTPAPAA